MKLTIMRSRLQEVASRAARATGRTTIPVLGNALIEAEDGRVHLTTTDLDSTLRQTVSAEVAEPGKTTAPAKLLADLAARMPDGPVTLTKTDGGLVATAGRSRFVLPVIDPEEFPSVEAPETTGEPWTFAGEQVRTIAATTFACSEEETRPILNGARLMADGQRITAVATNGHRLVEVSIPAEVPAWSEELIVHRAALARIGELFGERGCEVTPAAGGRLIFSDSANRLVIRTLEGPYPEYQKLWPESHLATVRADRAAMLDALARVDLAASDQTKRTRWEVNGAVVLSAGSDGREAREEIDAETEGKMTIGFSSRYVIEALKYLNADEVEWRLTAPERASVLVPVGDDSRRMLLMPLRLLD